MYRSVGEASIAEDAQLTGEIVHEAKEVVEAPRESVGEKLGRAIRWVLVLFLFGATLLWLVPDKLLGMTSTLDDRPAAAVGWGFVTLIGFPVVMILVVVLTSALTMAFGLMTLGKAVALVLMIGVMTLLVLSLALWIVLSYLAPVLAALAGGRRISIRDQSGPRSRYLSLLAGLVVLALLGLIPFVGTAIHWLVGLVGLGAVALWAVRYLARSQETQVQP